MTLLNKLDISPQFLPMLMGKPEYWAPGDFAVRNRSGKASRLGGCLE